ncbi:MAG: prolyl oligopeptidase family serine peptidase [Candidatus Aminicenantales bacterium]|jgi:dipeptidyl aminopeptidase/acylaminoacyl peptidase
MKFDRHQALIRLALAFFLLMSGHLQAQDKKVILTPWTTDDIINQETAYDFNLSPDGQKVVWVKSIPDKEKDTRLSHLFLSLTGKEQTGQSIQLTRGNKSESRPRWSPNGQLIAFISGRQEEEEDQQAEAKSGNQLWLLDLRGGEPTKVTDLEFGLIDFAWIDDNHFLVLAREDRTFKEIKEKEKKDDSIIFEDQEHLIPQRLFTYCLKEKKWHRLTDNRDQITNFYLSPDKKQVITRNNQSLSYETDKKIKPKFFLIKLADKTSQEIFPENFFKPDGIFWDKNNQGFYFSVMRTIDPVNETAGADFLYYYDLNSGRYQEINLNWEAGLMEPFLLVKNDGFIAPLAAGARPKWRRYYRQADGFSFEEIQGEHYPHIFSLTGQENGDQVVYAHSTASQPRVWYSGRLEKNKLIIDKPIAEINPGFKNKKIARTEVIKWKGALEEEVEGILYYPHDYQPGKKYPLFLNIHGGPTGIDLDEFDESYAYYPNLLAQKGCFVLRPNYHGSTGYGQKFVESIRGHYYDYPLEDMLKGIDYLIAKGLVDGDRLGTMGWSNGGILSIALLVWTNRFKVGGIGAADVDWISDYGTCAFGVSFDNYYLLGAPWEKPDYYQQMSPLFYFKDMKTPTIIFHGTEDTSVPFGQGLEHYRVLQQLGQAPVRFIVFPAEPHGLRKLSHQRRKMEEELAWFDRHFFKTASVENEALKPLSPLDLALKARSYARSGASYGLKTKGKLIPETVPWEDLLVGRFEVTRAQWQAFRPDYKFQAGTENYPVSGVSWEEAKQYVSWLSQLTGEDYRLPTVAEARRLMARGKASQDNILDYWAGYQVNFDEARSLQAVISGLKGQAGLLLPVDRFSPAGDSQIYGLAGSVAEWAVETSGQGKVTGLSAVHRARAENEGDYTPPPSDYTGLRVFKTAKKSVE